MEQKRFVSSAVAFRGDANANIKGLLRRGKNGKKKNASRFRACSTTPLQSILRESRREKMARDTESILSVFDFYLSTFVFCKPISQILSKKVVKVFIHGKIKYREKNLSLLSSCN